MSRLVDAQGRPMRSISSAPLPRRSGQIGAPPALAMGGAYRAADATSWENGWNPVGSSADRELAGELPRILERSNEAFRNDPLAQGIGWAFRILTVGGGRTPRPQIDLGDRKVTRAVRTRIRADFLRWAETAGSDGVTPLSEIQEQIIDSLVMSGGALTLWPMATTSLYREIPRLRIGLIDTRRLATPNLNEGGFDVNGNVVSLGVAYNTSREVQGYWVKRERKDGTSSGEHLFFPLGNGPRVISRLIHRPGPRRADQSRQPPLLTAALSLMYMLRTLLNAEMRGDIALTRLVGAIKSGDPQQITTMLQAYNDMLGDENVSADVLATMKEAMSRSVAEVGDATILNLASAESTEWFNAANRSNPSLGGLIEWAMRWVASCTGLPYQVCWMLFQGINYSNARTILMHSQQAAMPWSKRLDISDNITYRQWLYEYWALGNLPEVKNWSLSHTGVIWQTDEIPYLDPAKEAYANDTAVNSGQVSMPDVIGSRNGDWFETIKEQLEFELTEKELYEDAGMTYPPVRRANQLNAFVNAQNALATSDTNQ